MSTVDPKKIAILGGNPETGALVQVANSMGLHTVVLDPHPHSLAKRHAASAHEVDVTDLDAVDRVIRDEGVAGVLVGVADPLVPSYQKICVRNQMHCYATETTIHALTSKSNFAQACVAHGLSVTPCFDVDVSSPEDINQLDYPVVVKPVDAGAGVGISVCRNPMEFRVGVAKALAVSIRKELLIEKFMQCDDMFVYYSFVDGVSNLSALADGQKTEN
jgi:biotin carboxylase